MPLASEYLDRQELAPTGWSSAEWACVDAQVRERAFFMAGVQQAHILQEFRRMAAGVAAGEISPSEARIALREYLKATGYQPEEGKEGTLQDLSSRRRIELVLDTNVRQARGWAQHVQYQRDPNVGGQELFRRFRRSVPRNWELRWAEAAEAVGWEGVARGVPFVATLDSPIWRRLSRFDLPYPPFDFNSGMATRPVSVERCRELGLTPSETPPLPSLNEETSAGVAGMDADLVRSLESVMGGLVQRVGDRLQMADVNGTRPYTAPQLAAVWAAPLPKGVPNLQAEAMAAWRQDPKALLPGGNKRHLLPALRMLAARLRPEAPEELREWLREHGANDEVRNTAGGGEGVVANSAPPDHECEATVRPCPYNEDGEFEGVDMGFLESNAGITLRKWREEHLKKNGEAWAITDKKDHHLADGNRWTNERLNSYRLSDESENQWALSAKLSEFHHAMKHNLSEKELALIPDVFSRWDKLTRSAANGKYVFEKKYERKTYRLVCEKGGKKNLVGGKRLIRMVTFYEITDHKKEKKK